MGGDMVVALGRAAVDGRALFGHNWRQPGRAAIALHRACGRAHAPDERVQTDHLILPQARETVTALGVQTPGQWGYPHGVNAHGVAAGCTSLRTRLACDEPGLLGTDLVRLALERSRTARQAVDLIGDLVSRHGQGCLDRGAASDNAFLIADGREAFALETAGKFWVYQEVRQVRAMSDVCTVRQDWDGIAHGLAGCAIEHGWWRDDGSKVDFAGVVAPETALTGSPLRRWGRATLLLEEQNGHLDPAFLRRLLSDHYEGCADEVDPLWGGRGTPPLCLHARSPDALITCSSLVAQLDAPGHKMWVAWCCPGPPCTGIYLPILLVGDLPVAFTSGALHAHMRRLLNHIGGNRGLWDLAHDTLGRLQARIDQETDEHVADATRAGHEGVGVESCRQATLFMQHCLELFDETVNGLLRQRPKRPAERAAAPTEIPVDEVVKVGR
jgi:secernin